MCALPSQVKVQLAGMAQAILTQLWPTVAAVVVALLALACACGSRLLRCLCCLSTRKNDEKVGTEAVCKDTNQENFTTSDLWLRRSLSVGNGGRVLVEVSVNLNSLELPQKFLVEDTDPFVPLDDIWGLKDAQVSSLFCLLSVLHSPNRKCARCFIYVVDLL